MEYLSKKITLFLLILTLAMCFIMLGNTAYSASAENDDIVRMSETDELNESDAETVSAYVLQDSELYYRERVYDYNCYAYAIGKYKSTVNLGSLSGEAINIAELTIEQIADAVVDDLEAIGCTGIIVSDTRPTSVAQNQHLICVRKGQTEEPIEYDYHFMKYYDGSWYHKPHYTAILKYKYQPSEDRAWTNEYIDNKEGNAGEPSCVYTGKIYYIKYYPSTYNPDSGWCEVNNYWQLTELWHNCASNFKTRIMKDIVAEKEGLFEFWEKPYYFYGEIDGLNYSIKSLEFCPELDEWHPSDKTTPKYFYNVGFIQYNYGTIKNIAICNINENLNLGGYPTEGDRIKVGIIASENYGTIQNCFVGTTIIDGEIHLTAKTLSSIGAVSGVNYGTIKNCLIDYSHIKSFGRLGGVAGENRGTIENCSVSNSELISYYGAVGGVAGINYLSVANCTVSDTFIGCYYEYPDAQYFNEWEVDKYGKAGGIAGWNDGGVINPCSVVGNTVKYCGASINAANGGRSFAPEIGLICGASKPLTGTFINNDSVVDKGNLHVETWKGGFLNLVTYTWNQAQYCGGNVGHTL